MAAQRHFFEASNTAKVNGKTEAGYLLCERDPSKIGALIRKSLISMDEPGLLDDFSETLFQNIDLLKEGDFSIDPLIASYNDYESICRTLAIDRNDME